MKAATFRNSSALLLALLVSLALPGETHKSAQAAGTEDFFIISSVDAKKQQLLLKRPREVTELMVVTGKTVYVDELGKPLRFTDFRAGDTVYISSYRGAGGTRVATRIRIGPMTPEELHIRYLKFQ